ncbi:MAG: RpoL/Rpb11 RNA polymerase subunit family protein [Candidatus Pacearchaeota archaeon]
MKVNYLKEEKNEIELELDNTTIAEILRVYLAKDDNVDFVAWRKEHPTKNPILKIKTSNKSAKKALLDAKEKIEKDLDKVLDEFKKSIK